VQQLRMAVVVARLLQMQLSMLLHARLSLNWTLQQQRFAPAHAHWSLLEQTMP
jgi:hypothetical protein